MIWRYGLVAQGRKIIDRPTEPPTTRPGGSVSNNDAGDLRIPHFIGIYALQAIPLGLLAIELLSRRLILLREQLVRYRLMLIGALTFGAFLAIVTRQALIGEPIVAPSGPVLAANTITVAASILAALTVLITARASRGPRLIPPEPTVARSSATEAYKEHS